MNRLVPAGFLLALVFPPLLLSQEQPIGTGTDNAAVPVIQPPLERVIVRGASAPAKPSAGVPPESGEALGYAAVGAAIIATSPFWGPSMLLDDHIANPGYFPHHPYSDDLPGYLRIGFSGYDPTAPGDNDKPSLVKTWAVRVSLEDGNNFDDINRLNGRVFVDTTWRVGLWTNWSWLHQTLPRGCTDDSLLSDTNLTYRIAQSERVEIHAGGGFRMLNYSGGTRFGGNFLYSADLFLTDPFVLSGLFEIGWLGSDLVLEGRGTVGVIYHRVELFAGYDFLRIGSSNIQGPLAGIRLWF
jgi:hypothetical protein